MVAHVARFAHAVHSPDGIAHIHAGHGEGGAEHIAQGAATRHLTVVDETLTGNARLLADFGKNGCAEGIAQVFLLRVVLDDRAAAHHGMVCGVVLLAIIGMPCVGIVCADEEGAFYHAIVVVLRAALRQNDALHQAREEGAGCALLGFAAHFFVVEDGEHLCGSEG